MKLPENINYMNKYVDQLKLPENINHTLEEERGPTEIAPKKV